MMLLCALLTYVISLTLQSTLALPFTTHNMFKITLIDVISPFKVKIDVKCKLSSSKCKKVGKQSKFSAVFDGGNIEDLNTSYRGKCFTKDDLNYEDLFTGEEFKLELPRGGKIGSTDLTFINIKKIVFKDQHSQEINSLVISDKIKKLASRAYKNPLIWGCGSKPFDLEIAKLSDGVQEIAAKGDFIVVNNATIALKNFEFKDINSQGKQYFNGNSVRFEGNGLTQTGFFAYREDNDHEKCGTLTMNYLDEPNPSKWLVIKLPREIPVGKLEKITFVQYHETTLTIALDRKAVRKAAESVAGRPFDPEYCISKDEKNDKCGTLPFVLNGVIELSDGFNKHSLGTLNCGEGYETLEDENEIKCNAKGDTLEWSVKFPKILKCREAPDHCNTPDDYCLNGGDCTEAAGVKSCVCASGFLGKLCQRTPCSDDPCNGQACTPKGATFECACGLERVEGQNCDSEIQKKCGDPIKFGIGSSGNCECKKGFAPRMEIKEEASLSALKIVRCVEEKFENVVCPTSDFDRLERTSYKKAVGSLATGFLYGETISFSCSSRTQTWTNQYVCKSDGKFFDSASKACDVDKNATDIANTGGAAKAWDGKDAADGEKKDATNPALIAGFVLGTISLAAGVFILVYVWKKRHSENQHVRLPE